MSDAADAGRRLLALARGLSRELHGARRRAERATLDSSLDRDFGLDSLARVELWGRVEREFGVSLPEALLGEAELLRDVLAALLRGGARLAKPDPTRRERIAPEELVETPEHATTLLEAFAWHVDSHPQRPHLVLVSGPGIEEVISYGMLAEAARRVAGGLQSRGVGRGSSVAIMLPTGRDFFEAFVGVLFAGGVPVPIYPPARPTQLEDHLRRQVGILSNAGASVLIADSQARRVARLMRPLVPGMRDVLGVEELTAETAEPARPIVHDGDLALLQYTSGSTGQPKGVELSHANLLANIRAMGQVLEATSRDVFVSWLPLYHDMGLIGAWLGSLYHAVPAVILSPLQFLARPESWLWAIHRHRGTLSAAPNFGYELCVRRIIDSQIEGLDLSSWRFAANGAEPVSAATLRRFTARFAAHGFRAEAMAPVYGLAECAVGLAFPPLGRGPLVDRVDRDALTRRGQAIPAAADAAHAVELVACGRPLPGHEIRIVDITDHELGERHEGRVQFRGPSATRGYFRNEARTRELLHGSWLDSGDLGYMAGGDVYLTGRTKDLIIRAGRNVYPDEVEEAVGEIPGVRKGCVAVFGSADPDTPTERIVVVAETRETEGSALGALRERIEDAAAAFLDGPPDDVVLAPPHSVLKTSSGKIRRTACRELYEAGKITQRRRAVWFQVLRLAWAGARPRVREALRAVGTLLYAAWWWGLLVAIAIPAWLAVLVAPGVGARWALLRVAARAHLLLSGTPLHVEGLARLPAAPSVLVTNHASYFDGLALVAALPRGGRFVAKKELETQRVAGPFLRRLGAIFVERVDPRGGVEDTRQVVEALREPGGERPLVFFPEGTFTRMPGLLPFKLGAFVAAAETGACVIPAALTGTRSILRGDQWLPRRGRVTLRVGDALVPRGTGWQAAIQLRDRARSQVLKLSGEPDLA